jgi:hypothetical protein
MSFLQPAAGYIVRCFADIIGVQMVQHSSDTYVVAPVFHKPGLTH